MYSRIIKNHVISLLMLSIFCWFLCYTQEYQFTLDAISAEQFPQLSQLLGKSYAQQLQKFGFDEQESLQTCANEMALLLPAKEKTPHQYILSINKGLHETVGFIWYAHDPATHTAELQFIMILEPYQGKGLGLKALQLLENHCSRKGISRIILSVFSKNDKAIALYKKAGFLFQCSILWPNSNEIFRYEMAKELIC